MNNSRFPKVSLGFFPTPIVKLARLSKVLGSADIYMKRDDMSGLALGGNKTRKLEYILADALAHHCDTVITAGAVQSNHCRQTAAAAAYLNLECHLLLGGNEPQQVQGNLLLDHLFSAHIHWAGEHRKGEHLADLHAELVAAGKKPYVVPYGGSNQLGVLSFVDAVEELLVQTIDGNFTHIIFASSSGGTHAGLMLGKKVFNQQFDLVGIKIDKQDELNIAAHIISLANDAATMIGLEAQFTRDDFTLQEQYTGEGYGVVGALEKEAISLTAKSEGVLLDPVYTGRAMGGLIDMLRTGFFSKSDKILFWHTGGTPALFDYAKHLTGFNDERQL
jgi:D-cysteine desulfhydrase